MQLELSENETQALAHIIGAYYSNLREEIYKTETPKAKDLLKEEEKLIKNLLDRLGTGTGRA